MVQMPGERLNVRVWCAVGTMITSNYGAALSFKITECLDRRGEGIHDL